MDTEQPYAHGQWIRWDRRFGEIRSVGKERVCVYWPIGALAVKWYDRRAFEEALRRGTFVLDETMAERTKRGRSDAA